MTPTIPLQLAMVLERDGVRLRIDNPSDTAVRVWDLGNSWGGASWSLLLRTDGAAGRTFTLRPANQIYSRNIPRFIEVAPKGHHEIRLTPGAREWTTGEDSSSLRSATIHVRAVLEIASSPEATTHNVAIGRVESAEVPSTPPHTWLFVAPGP